MAELKESTVSSKKVYDGLKKKYIYVKGNYKHPLDSCLLLTCGPKRIMSKVVFQVKIILKKI